jgi:hypothetical protein
MLGRYSAHGLARLAWPNSQSDTMAQAGRRMARLPSARSPLLGLARLPASGMATRWGTMAGEGTSGARPPSRARWLAAELTGVTRQRGGREKQSVQQSSIAVRRFGGGRRWPRGPVAHRWRGEGEGQARSLEKDSEVWLTERRRWRWRFGENRWRGGGFQWWSGPTTARGVK